MGNNRKDTPLPPVINILEGQGAEGGALKKKIGKKGYISRSSTIVSLFPWIYVASRELTLFSSAFR